MEFLDGVASALKEATMERLATRGAYRKLQGIPAVPLYAASVRDRLNG